MYYQCYLVMISVLWCRQRICILQHHYGGVVMLAWIVLVILHLSYFVHCGLFPCFEVNWDCTLWRFESISLILHRYTSCRLLSWTKFFELSTIICSVGVIYLKVYKSESWLNKLITMFSGYTKKSMRKFVNLSRKNHCMDFDET